MEVRWNKEGTVSTGRRNENYQLGTRYLYTTEKYQQLKEWCLLVKGFIYIFLRGGWRNIKLFNVHKSS